MASRGSTGKDDCNCEQTSLHLHAEIENLKQKLLERENHILSMETNFLCEAEKFPNGEYAALNEEIMVWQDKYARLLESHKRVQRVNQSLEDKLLLLVDKTETEKNLLNTEISMLTQKIVDQQMLINQQNENNERFKSDLNIAIHLLQCKPNHFIPQKFDTLPSELQSKVRGYVSSKHRRQSDGNGNVALKSPGKILKVPINTFPPTAMVYSLTHEKDTKSKDVDESNDIPASVLAKILEERVQERLAERHCYSCSCNNKNGEYNMDQNSSPNDLSEKQVRPYNKNVKKPSTTKNSESLTSDLNQLSCVDNPVSVDSSDNGLKLSVRPRVCSVRLQEGSNNILLDNAGGSYSGPVLYKSRSSSGEFDEPLVHSQKLVDRNETTTRILISDEEII